MTKSLLKELLIMFSSRWVRRVNLHFMLFILMGERSSSSNQSIVMNVFRDIQGFFQGVGNSPNLPFSPSAAWFNTHHPTLSESRDLNSVKSFTVNDVTLGKCLILSLVLSSVY